VTAPDQRDRRFDSLVHVTKTGAWINGRDDASFERLLDELDRAHVGHACLVGLAGVVDNAFLLECVARAPDRLIPIAGIDPTGEDPAQASDLMGELRRRGFRGIKLHPRLHGYDPLDPAAVAMMASARDHSLVVFLDTLFRQRAVATRFAADIVDSLAHQCAGTTLVLLHGGGPQLLSMAEVVRVHPHLFLDVSYTLLAYKHSSVALDLRWVFTHLDQRVVVGSDMPEYTPDETFAEAARLAEGLPTEKWANISHRNLSRLFLT